MWNLWLRRAALGAVTAAMLGGSISGALAQTKLQTKLKVMVFPGVQNLPLFAAQAKGFFARHGLDVELLNTPNSQELRDGLAQGRHQIVHGGIDNAVAMAEVAKADIAVVIGGDNGFNHLFLQPGIGAIKDLRGKTVIVDAVNTAYAFQVYAVLKQNGLNKGDYEVKPVGATFKRLETMQQDKDAAASSLNPPFSILASRSGLKDAGEMVKMIGPYQATGAWVMRSWGEANADTLVQYLQAYIQGLRWAVDPDNKAEMVAMMAERLKLAPDVAAQSYAVATDPQSGFAKDAKLDLDGFRNVLKLRADLEGQWGGTPPSPEKYIDASYYDRALKGL
jgi:ABC-type nitrate/sulfonate/bicarbonate transport system substrate-binding protein